MAEVYLGMGRAEPLIMPRATIATYAPEISTAAMLENILARCARIEARLIERERWAAATLPPLRPEPDPPDGPPWYAAAQPPYQPYQPPQPHPLQQHVTSWQTTSEPYFNNQPPLWKTPPPPPPQHYFHNQPTPSNDYHQSLQQSDRQPPLVTAALPRQNYPQLPPLKTYQPPLPRSNGENMSDLDESDLSSSNDSASSGKNMSNTLRAEDESTLNSYMCIQNGTNVDHLEEIITDARNTKMLFMERESAVHLMEQVEVRDHAAEQSKTEDAKVKEDLQNEIKEDSTIKQVYGSRWLARNLEESLDGLIEVTRVTDVEGSKSKIDEMETQSLVDEHKANKEIAVSHTMEILKKKAQTCTFDPEGNTLLKLLLAMLFVVTWFPP